MDDDSDNGRVIDVGPPRRKRWRIWVIVVGAVLLLGASRLAHQLGRRRHRRDAVSRGHQRGRRTQEASQMERARPVRDGSRH